MAGPGRYARLFLAFARFGLAQEMAFRANFLIKLLVEAMWLAILLVFYDVVFSKTSRSSGPRKASVVGLLSPDTTVRTARFASSTVGPAVCATALPRHSGTRATTMANTNSDVLLRAERFSFMGMDLRGRSEREHACAGRWYCASRPRWLDPPSTSAPL